MTGLITDPEFDLSLAKEYKLSILASLDGFSFSVVHEEQNKLLAVKYSPATLSSGRFLGRHFNEWLNKHSLLTSAFKHSEISYYSKDFTFIPEEYYDPDNMHITANMVMELQNDMVLVENNLPGSNGRIIFPVFESVMKTVDTFSPQCKLLHPVTLFARKLNKTVQSNEESVTLLIMEKSFFLLFHKNSKIEAVNSFNYSLPVDILFFTLSALKKYNVKAGNIILYMAGAIDPKSELHLEFNKHFKQIIFFSPDVKFNSDIFKVPLHHYIVLF